MEDIGEGGDCGQMRLLLMMPSVCTMTLRRSHDVAFAEDPVPLLVVDIFGHGPHLHVWTWLDDMIQAGNRTRRTIPCTEASNCRSEAFAVPYSVMPESTPPPTPTLRPCVQPTTCFPFSSPTLKPCKICRRSISAHGAAAQTSKHELVDALPTLSHVARDPQYALLEST